MEWKGMELGWKGMAPYAEPGTSPTKNKKKCEKCARNWWYCDE